MRPSDLGLKIGLLEPGPRDSITDIPGVRVGHCTVHDDARAIHTGVTIIEPCPDPWTDKPMAASFVLNGRGKSVGLLQLDELGFIESHIGLTNTLSVWAVADAIAKRVIREHPDVVSVAVTVGECNDSHINDIARFAIGEEHVAKAFDALSTDVPEGSVGAGAGFIGWGLKAGIGTASRVVEIQGERYTVGSLVASNCGALQHLRIDGFPVGRWLKTRREAAPNPKPDGGSIMLFGATNAPMDVNQLRRVAKRVALGLARVGGTAGHGSGDVIICFGGQPAAPLPGGDISKVFTAMIEATEAAIIHSLFAAEDAIARDGTVIPSLPKKEVVERVLAARAALFAD